MRVVQGLFRKTSLKQSENSFTATLVMDNANPLPPSSLNMTSLTITQERTPFNKMMACKASSVLRIIQVVQRAALKSCRRACQMFCCPMDTGLCELVRCCPAHQHLPMESTNAQVTFRSLPSTILIVNISNSTLIDCVIGSNNYQAEAVAESQPLMQKSGLQMHDRARCSCSHGQQGAAHTAASPPTINIQSSHLNCVIIGDNNNMQVEQTSWAETEE